MIVRTLVLALVLLLPSAVSAQCHASPGRSRSIGMRLSPRAGIQCLHIVDVYAGAACEGAPEWSIELHCSQTSRIAVTDGGRLISILAPRASRLEWNILHVVGRDQRAVWIRLRDVPGREALRGTLALDFDGAAVRMRARSAEARATFDAIEALAATRGAGR